MIAIRPPVWRKSSYSANGANCVEVASNLPGVVAVRDSKDVAGPELAFTGQAWSAFVAGIKRGELSL
jgi:Domain of unknown function (DUF397)